MLNPFRKFVADFCPTGAHGGGEVVHFQPRRVESHPGQKGFKVTDAFGGVEISFQEMTLTLQSPRHEKAVDPPFEGAQHIAVVDLARAGHADDLDVVRVG